MATMDWAMLLRRRAAIQPARHGAQALVMVFWLSLLSGCNVELFGRPPIWMTPTQHPIGHLLVFVTAMLVVSLLVTAIADLIRWVAEIRRHHAHPLGRRSHP